VLEYPHGIYIPIQRIPSYIPSPLQRIPTYMVSFGIEFSSENWQPNSPILGINFEGR
jgi:hypothetical protein